MKKIWNIITSVLIVFLVLILLFNVITFVKRQNGDQCPTVLGIGMAIVITGSMEPKIGVDDLVVIWHQESYEPDNVVTYYGNTYPVTHRIKEIRIDENGEVWYKPKGDVNDDYDAEITADQIVGRVIMVIPNVGSLQRFMQSSNGLLVLTMCAALLIGFNELIGTIRRRKY